MTQDSSKSSKRDWQQIKDTGVALEGLQTLEKLLGEKITVNFSKDGTTKWLKLLAEYEDFYKMTIEERLKASGLKS